MEKIFEHFTVTVLKLNKLIQRIKQFEMQEYGLKAVHVMCIYYLDKFPDGLTFGELVKLTLDDKAAISRAIATLKEKGYAVYDNGRHGSRVKLTEDGFKIAKAVTERSDKAVFAGSADFSDSEREFFYKALNSIAGNLTEYYDNLTSGK